MSQMILSLIAILCLRMVFQGKLVHPELLHHKGIKPALQRSMMVCLGPRFLASFTAASNNPDIEVIEELHPTATTNL